MTRKNTLVAAILILLGVSGCASVDFDRSVARTNQAAADFTQGKLALSQTSAQREESEHIAGELLKQPLSQGDAVQLALVNSPALQAMLAENWASALSAAQSGRIPNPLVAFSRVRVGAELDIERALSIGLLDLLTLPQRYAVAQQRIEQSHLRLAVEVVNRVTQVRQAWVRAVAARQTVLYAKQVFDSAEASAELARRMQAAGNFSKLARARQQVFYAEAATQWAVAAHAATASREQLVRLLGLTDGQAAQLRLPDRLPDLPRTAREPAEVSQAASAGRMDIRIAQSQLESAAKAQGLGAYTTFTDIEIGLRRDTKFNDDEGTRTPGRGYEVSVRLPIFDSGGLRRDAMNAQTLAAANRLEETTRAAGSSLRQTYSAYRTAHDIARHFRDEVLPLRTSIAEENVLRYNGMLIGVFELLADARDQVRSVMSAIASEEQFWFADATLKASIAGNPAMASVGALGAGASASGDAAH